MVRIPVRTKFYLEDEIDSQQPMTSLFEQSLLLLGDVAAKMMIDRRHLDMKGLWQYHANLE
jgi:6-phospho-3-hexuloisomerase